MSNSKQIFKTEAPYHIMVWLLLIGPHSIFSYRLLEDSPLKFLINLGVQDGLIIVITYVNIYILIEKFYRRRQYILYFIILAFLLLIYSVIGIYTERYIFSRETGEGSDLFGYLFYLANIGRYTIIGFLLFNLREKYRQKKQLDQMEVEKLHAEVNYLRAQINPHFLFNTLNNLYALALEKSDRAPGVIMRLSRMMDYMLYEMEGTKVLLSKDIENLENYIDLERIRQGNQAVIHYTKSGEVKNEVIEPLLMLPLVENAFKHGVNQLISGAYLEISLSVSNYRLLFSVKNNYKPKAANSQMHGNLGLANLRKRLLLFYPAKHTLEINDDGVNYEVQLELNLA